MVKINVKPNMQPLYYQRVYFEDFDNIHILLGQYCHSVFLFKNIIRSTYSIRFYYYIFLLFNFIIQFLVNQMSKPILQVISLNPKDSITIQKAGADRIQLVSALEVGGLSPSIAMVRKSLQCVEIPTMVMIRHHNNGFCYSQQEIQIFLDQINEFKNIGVKGIVVGGITIQNKLNQTLIKQVNQITSSNKIDWTFHKAFDQTNIVQSYQKLSENLVPRVLTQGGKLNITQNYQSLSHIVQKSKQKNHNFRTKVLLGGGITGQNVQQIIKFTKAEQIHVGTCVRKNKYQEVLFQKVQELVQKINQAYKD